MEGEGEVAQYSLEGEKLPIYNFSQNTMIWLQRRGRGVVQNEAGLSAIPALDRKGEQRRSKNLSLWQSLETARLYLDGRYWSLPQKSFFSAYKSNAKKVRVKK